MLLGVHHYHKKMYFGQKRPNALNVNVSRGPCMSITVIRLDTIFSNSSVLTARRKKL